MFKSIISILCIIALAFTTKSQDAITQNAIGESGQVSVPGRSAGQLYSAAKLFATKITAARHTIDMEDMASHTLVLKPGIPVMVPMPLQGKRQFYVYFNFTIQCSDSAAKYSASNYYLTYQPGTAMPAADYPLTGSKPKGMADKNWQAVQLQAAETTRQLIDHFIKEMKPAAGI